MVAGELAPNVVDAWEHSVLGGLPEPSARRLLDAASEVEFPAGELIYRQLHQPESSFVALIVHGMVKVAVSSPRGREVAIRWSEHGDITGLPALVAGGARGSLQVITDCRLLHFETTTVRHLAQTDPAVGWVICQELTRLAFATNEQLAMNVFATVMERVAGSLLHVAQQEDDAIVVRASHQDIADAIGTVREVVTRAIRQLRDARIVDRSGQCIVIRDMDALRRVADLHRLDSGA